MTRRLTCRSRIGMSLSFYSPNHVLTSHLLYSNTHDISLHLMAHIYANRCAPLWKESSVANWMRQQVSIVADDLASGKRRLPSTPVPVDQHNQTGNMPLWLIRHAYLSETYMGFMPPDVAAHMGHAFDPIPPFTAKTFYNDAYFNSSRSATHRSMTSNSSGLQDPNLAGVRDRLMNWVNQLGGDENNRQGFMYAITEALRDMLTTDEYANANPAQRQEMDDMVSRSCTSHRRVASYADPQISPII